MVRSRLLDKFRLRQFEWQLCFCNWCMDFGMFMKSLSLALIRECNKLINGLWKMCNFIYHGNGVRSLYLLHILSLLWELYTKIGQIHKLRGSYLSRYCTNYNCLSFWAINKQSKLKDPCILPMFPTHDPYKGYKWWQSGIETVTLQPTKWQSWQPEISRSVHVMSSLPCTHAHTTCTHNSVLIPCILRNLHTHKHILTHT